MNERSHVCPNGCQGAYEINTSKIKGLIEQRVICLMCNSTMTPVVAIVHQQPNASPVREQQNF